MEDYFLRRSKFVNILNSDSVEEFDQYFRSNILMLNSGIDSMDLVFNHILFTVVGANAINIFRYIDSISSEYDFIDLTYNDNFVFRYCVFGYMPDFVRVLLDNKSLDLTSGAANRILKDLIRERVMSSHAVVAMIDDMMKLLLTDIRMLKTVDLYVSSHNSVLKIMYNLYGLHNENEIYEYITLL